MNYEYTCKQVMCNELIIFMTLANVYGPSLKVMYYVYMYEAMQV